MIGERVAGGAVGLHRLSRLPVFDRLIAGGVPACRGSGLHARDTTGRPAFDASAHGGPHPDAGLGGFSGQDQCVDGGHHGGDRGPCYRRRDNPAGNSARGAQPLAAQLAALVPACHGAGLGPVKQAAEEALGPRP